MIDFLKLLLDNNESFSFSSFLFWGHELCLKFFENSTHSSLNQALVCGKPLPFGSSHRSVLTQTALIHILVVSGLHLNIVKSLVTSMIQISLSHPSVKYCLGFCIKYCIQNSLKQKILTQDFLTEDSLAKIISFLIWIFLGCYALMTGWNPPVVRALLEYACLLKMRSHQAIVSSWLLCLFLHPTWSESISLHLSVVARSAIFLGQNRSLMMVTLMVTLSIFPLLGFYHPLIPFFSCLVSPFLLGSLAFNVALETFTLWVDSSFWIFLETMNQKFLHSLFKILEHLGGLFPPTKKHQLLPKGLPQLFYLTFYLTFLYLEGLKRQRSLILKPRDHETSQSLGFYWLGFLFFLLVGQPLPLF
jgi:hypothetical protein